MKKFSMSCSFPTSKTNVKCIGLASLIALNLRRNTMLNFTVFEYYCYLQ